MVIMAVRDHDRIKAALESPRNKGRPGGTRAVSVWPYPGIDENPGASRLYENRRTADLTASSQHLNPQVTVGTGMSDGPVSGGL